MSGHTVPGRLALRVCPLTVCPLTLPWSVPRDNGTFCTSCSVPSIVSFAYIKMARVKLKMCTVRSVLENDINFSLHGILRRRILLI